MPTGRRIIITTNSDEDSHRRALGFLAGRFSFKTWATGEIMVSDAALPALTAEGIPYQIKGRPTYEAMIPGPIGNRPPKVIEL